MEFLTKPRTFLAKRGFFIPHNAKMSVIPTEELQARLFTSDGVAAFVAHQRSNTAKIKMHVKTGLAKCIRIEFECPKKKKKKSAPKQFEPKSQRSISSGMSIEAFSDLILAAENSDSIADELLTHPRRFFERRGFYAPPNTRFDLTSSDQLFETLRGERAIVNFLGQQAAASFDVHIKKGKGKCTLVTVECNK
ncbi:MAG: hypothetical protein GY803_02325 [Chloroflexi bacterium]|nr:hypothetical protein [Chloroflexota bacterium]